MARLDYKRHVAYLGPTGTFCHLAAKEHFSDTAELTPMDDVAEVCCEQGIALLSSPTAVANRCFNK